jgi:hypothetical protein
VWSDAQILLLLLGLLYAGECLVWVPAGGILLVRRGRRWMARTADGGFGNRRGTLLPASWNPGSPAVAVEVPFRLSLAPEGLVAFRADQPGVRRRPPQTGRALPWTGVATLSRRHQEWRDEQGLWARAATEAEAARGLSWLRSLAALPPAEREERLRAEGSRAADVEAARRRLAEIRAAARGLSGTSLALFLYAFLLAPSLSLILGVERVLLPLLLGVLPFQIAIPWLFVRAHRRLCPEAMGDRRLGAFKLALSPPAAMRAPSLLWREALTGVPALAVLAAEGASDALRDLGRRMLLDALHPLDLDECPPEGRAAEAWARERRIEALRAVLLTAGEDPESLVAPPAEWEPGVTAYCPRCRQGYLRAEAPCAECRLHLRPAR